MQVRRRTTALGVAGVAALTTVAAATAGGGAAGASTGGARHAGATPPTVVVSGLNNPRALSLTEDGHLLVAEAGKGGKIRSVGPDGPTFLGDSGSVSWVRSPRTARNTSPVRIFKGLLSAADEHGVGAVGPDGVSQLHADSPILVQETYGPPDDVPSRAAWQNGYLLAGRPGGGLAQLADITGFERANDPDGYGFDSDPYAVLAVKGGAYVADAAGNDVLFVNRSGSVRLFHVFPNVTTGACAGQADPSPQFPGCNFVPTSLAVDKSGHLYVGGLSSLTPGAAKVVELSRDGSAVLRTWNDFSGVSGLAIADDGTVYVSQLFAPEANAPNPQITGVVTRIDPSGTRTNTDVPFPSGVVLVPGGAREGRNQLLVSAFSIAPATGLGFPGTSGQVWRFRF